MGRGASTISGSKQRAASPTMGMPESVRSLPRRRAVPNSRAALGGLLVALAVVLLFSVAEGRGSTHLEHYVVARRPLAIGSRLTASDITTATMHLPAGALRGRVFTSRARVVGAVVIAPVAAGELVQASAIVAAESLEGQRQISVPVEAARALGNRLQPGELVDVVATFGTGADAFTIAVVRGARVVARDANAGPLGDRRGEVLVLGVRTADEAVAVAHAIAAGQISLVRVSGIDRNTDSDGVAPYRAPRPGPSR